MRRRAGVPHRGEVVAVSCDYSLHSASALGEHKANGTSLNDTSATEIALECCKLNYPVNVFGGLGCTVQRALVIAAGGCEPSVSPHLPPRRHVPTEANVRITSLGGTSACLEGTKSDFHDGSGDARLLPAFCKLGWIISDTKSQLRLQRLTTDHPKRLDSLASLRARASSIYDMPVRSYAPLPTDVRVSM